MHARPNAPPHPKSVLAGAAVAPGSLGVGWGMLLRSCPAPCSSLCPPPARPAQVPLRSACWLESPWPPGAVRVLNHLLPICAHNRCLVTEAAPTNHLHVCVFLTRWWFPRGQRACFIPLKWPITPQLLFTPSSLIGEPRPPPPQLDSTQLGRGGRKGLC